MSEVASMSDRRLGNRQRVAKGIAGARRSKGRSRISRKRQRSRCEYTELFLRGPGECYSNNILSEYIEFFLEKQKIEANVTTECVAGKSCPGALPNSCSIPKASSRMPQGEFAFSNDQRLFLARERVYTHRQLRTFCVVSRRASPRCHDAHKCG